MTKKYFTRLLQASLMCCLAVLFTACDDMFATEDNPTSAYLGMSDKPVTIKVGETFLRQATSASTAVVEYTSSDTKIATVDNTGLVTAIAEGEATITATATGYSSQTGKKIYQPDSKSYKLTVKPATLPAATINTAPVATAGDIIAGSATALVTAGVADGGTMMYRVTPANEVKPTSTEGFSADIPSASNRAAGTYSVWYYAKGDAYEGAFTTYLPDFETPVIYFGPGYFATDTFVHEFGHYFAAALSEDGGDSLPYDLAETQSQGDEFLFAYWFEYIEPSYVEVAHAVAEYKIYDVLTSILTASLVNDFETYVYTHLDALTPEELDGVLVSLCDAYGGYDAVKAALGYEPEIYWHHVVMEAPGYYVSYAASAIPTLALYATAKTEGFRTAVEAYSVIVTADPEAGFLAALDEAGIGSPFRDRVKTNGRQTWTASRRTRSMTSTSPI